MRPEFKGKRKIFIQSFLCFDIRRGKEVNRWAKELSSFPCGPKRTASARESVSRSERNHDATGGSAVGRFWSGDILSRRRRRHTSFLASEPATFSYVGNDRGTPRKRSPSGRDTPLSIASRAKKISLVGRGVFGVRHRADIPGMGARDDSAPCDRICSGPVGLGRRVACGEGEGVRGTRDLSRRSDRRRGSGKVFA